MINQNSKIKKLVAEYDKSRPKVVSERKARLAKLLDQYGYDNVALASGWSIGTISQYMQSNTALIGLERLNQAETILKQL